MFARPKPPSPPVSQRVKMLTEHNQFVRFLRNADWYGSCWIWKGNINADGYGRIKHDGKMRRSHRLLWESLNGPVPAGKQLDHLCRCRHCIRPSHLEVVTSQLNTLRGQGPAAKNAVKTHCKSGHVLEGRNLVIGSDRNGRKRRACRECSNARGRKYRKSVRVMVYREEA